MPHGYETRVGPTPPSPAHPRPSWRAQTLDPGESSSLRPQEPHSPPVQDLADDLPLDLSLAFIVRQPFFHCGPILGNSDCSTREVHYETYYDFPAFVADPELRDSMRLVHRYSLEPFMTQRRFFYPRVVIEFYHTMTSRRVRHPIVIHFSIDGHEGTLQAADITTAFHFPVVLANSDDYRLWPHPLPREMVRILSRDVTAGSVLFRRQLPPSMLLIDHILRSNIFPLQHNVQQRGAILEALYRIFKGYWFSPAELFMTSLFHFEDKVHRRNLIRAESTPLLFLRLLCQVLERLGFPAEPQSKRRRDCEDVLTIDRWPRLPHAQHLPPQDVAEDIAIDYPTEDAEEPQTAPPVPPAPTASDGLSTSAPPPQYISISTRVFLAIMDTVRTFLATSASFAAAHTTLVERMTHTEAVFAQTTSLLAQNHAILVQM